MHMVCVSCEYMECMFPRIACVSMECVIFTVCECVYMECMYVKYVGCVFVWSTRCIYGYSMQVCVRRVLCVVCCVRVYVFSEGAMENTQRLHFSCSALNGEGFLDAADGLKRAAVKLEENRGEDQIGAEAKAGASL